LTPTAHAGFDDCMFVSTTSPVENRNMYVVNPIGPTMTRVLYDLTAPSNVNPLRVYPGKVPMQFANRHFSANPHAVIPETCSMTTMASIRGFEGPASTTNGHTVNDCPAVSTIEWVQPTWPSQMTSGMGVLPVASACEQYRRENPGVSGSTELPFMFQINNRIFPDNPGRSSVSFTIRTHYELSRHIVPFGNRTPYTDVMAQNDCQAGISVVMPIQVVCNYPVQTPQAPIGVHAGGIINIGTIGGILTPPPAPAPMPAPVARPGGGCATKDCSGPPIIILPEEM
jgi:hypothetical protein